MEEDLNTFLEHIEEKFKKNNNQMRKAEFVQIFLEDMNFPIEDVKALFDNIDSEKSGWISFEQLKNYCNQNKDQGIMITPEIVSEAKQLYEYCLENYKLVSYELLIKVGLRENANMEGLKKIFAAFQNFPDSAISESNFSESISKYEQELSQMLIKSEPQNSLLISNTSNVIKIDSIIDKLFDILLGINIEKTKLKQITSSLEFLKLYSEEIRMKEKTDKIKLDQLQSELEMSQETVNKYKLEQENFQNEKENYGNEIRKVYNATVAELENKMDEKGNENQQLKLEVIELTNKLIKTESDLNNQVTKLRDMEKERGKFINQLNLLNSKLYEGNYMHHKLVVTNTKNNEKLDKKYEKMNKEQLLKEISFINNHYIKEKEIHMESLNEELEVNKAMLREKIEENINLYNDINIKKKKIESLKEVIRHFHLKESNQLMNGSIVSSFQSEQMEIENLKHNYLTERNSMYEKFNRKDGTSENQNFVTAFENPSRIEESQDKNSELKELLPLKMRESLERNMFTIEEENDTGRNLKENKSKSLDIQERKKSEHQIIANLDVINLTYCNQKAIINENLKSTQSIKKNESNPILNCDNLTKTNDRIFNNKSFIPTQYKEENSNPNLNINIKGLKNKRNRIDSSNYTDNSTPTPFSEVDQNNFESFNPNKPQLASHVI